MQSLGAGDGNWFTADQNGDMPWERNRICRNILEKQGIQGMERDVKGIKEIITGGV